MAEPRAGGLAFVECDGFQCGYCTPGQICSAVGMLAEVQAGWPSHATADVASPRIALTDEEIRERMSGNLCRRAAYPNIVAAIRAVAKAGQPLYGFIVGATIGKGRITQIDTASRRTLARGAHGDDPSRRPGAGCPRSVHSH